VKRSTRRAAAPTDVHPYSVDNLPLAPKGARITSELADGVVTIYVDGRVLMHMGEAVYHWLRQREPNQ
jgi:hypothetical protein